MASLVKAHLPYFELLAGVSKKQIKGLMETLNRGQVDAICEVLLNVRYGYLELDEEVKKKVKRKKTFICKLTTKGGALKHRRAALVQQATFFHYLLNELLDTIKKLD